MKTSVLFENEFCIILNADSRFLRVDKILLTCMYVNSYFDGDNKLVNMQYMPKIHYRHAELSTLKFKTICGLVVNIPLFSLFFDPQISASKSIENVTCKKCTRLYAAHQEKVK